MKSTLIAAQVSTPSEREIRFERVFDAPRKQVWRAFTDPALVAQWWGRGNKLVVERMEVAPGGHWRYVEHSPKGLNVFGARCREIKPQGRLGQAGEGDGLPGGVAIDTAVARAT